MPLYSYYKINTELSTLSGYQRDIFFSREDFTPYTFTTLLTNINTFLSIWDYLLSHHTPSFSRYVPLSAHMTLKGVQWFFPELKQIQLPWGLWPCKSAGTMNYKPTALRALQSGLWILYHADQFIWASEMAVWALRLLQHSWKGIKSYTQLFNNLSQSLVHTDLLMQSFCRICPIQNLQCNK